MGYVERRCSREGFSREGNILIWAMKKKQELNRRKHLAEETAPVTCGMFRSCKEFPVSGTKGEHSSMRVMTAER